MQRPLSPQSGGQARTDLESASKSIRPSQGSLSTSFSVVFAKLRSLIKARWTRVPSSLRRAAIGLDLGSETGRAHASGRSAALATLPSAIALEESTDRVVAIGRAARQMIGRTPGALRVETPIQQGVIAQPAEAELLIQSLLSTAFPQISIAGPHVVVSVASEATSVQRHALRAACLRAGAGRVSLVRESLAAALGAELPILDAGANLLIEMGAEKSEIAVISLGGIVESRSVPVGGRDISLAITQALRRKHNLVIGEATADTLKHTLGSTVEVDDPKTARVSGRDLSLSRPGSVEIKANELVPAINEAIKPLRMALREVLERTPPELASDIAHRGITLSGGASQLGGLEATFATSSGLAVFHVDDPAESVIRGCRRLAASPELLEAVSVDFDRED